MANTTEYNTLLSLGAGSIVGESFSILFKNIIPVTLMALVPMLFGTMISVAVLGYEVAVGAGEPVFFSTGDAVEYFSILLLQLALYGLSTALLVQLAYDAKLDRPIQMGRYFGPALRAAFPIAVLMIVSTLLTMVGALALIIGALWVYAVFSVVAPAVVIEGAGFRGLGRSASLTKGYRWPIVGTLLLIGICTGIVNFLATYLAGLLADTGVIGMVGVYSLLTAFGAGLTGIAVALIYARLREIKEGVSVDQIAAVFD